LCSASTYWSSPRATTLAVASGGGTAVVAAAVDEPVADRGAVAAAPVGSASFAVVRMKSGDPRYQPMATMRTAATIAPILMAGRMSQVSG
jgi:hypothetical protein